MKKTENKTSDPRALDKKVTDKKDKENKAAKEKTKATNKKQLPVQDANSGYIPFE